MITLIVTVAKVPETSLRRDYFRQAPDAAGASHTCRDGLFDEKGLACTGSASQTAGCVSELVEIVWRRNLRVNRTHPTRPSRICISIYGQARGWDGAKAYRRNSRTIGPTARRLIAESPGRGKASSPPSDRSVPRGRHALRPESCRIPSIDICPGKVRPRGAEPISGQSSSRPTGQCQGISVAWCRSRRRCARSVPPPSSDRRAG